MTKVRCLFLLTLSLMLAPSFCLAQDSGVDALDTDSDGKVTKKEFKEYAKSRLPDFDQLDKFADRVDADKDGAISEDEFEGRMDALNALQLEMLDGGDKKKEMTKEELEMVDKATKAYNATAKLVSKGDWKEAAQGMTKQASDEYAVTTVARSIALTQMELPPQMDTPAFNDAKDAIIDVIEDYKLGDIDVSSILRIPNNRNRPNSSDAEEDSDDDKTTPQEKAKARLAKAKAQQDKTKAEIMAAIDKNEQRWEIIAALRAVQKGSPLGVDVFTNKVSDDSDIDDKTVFLTVTRDGPNERIAIPTVVKMTAEKGDWKYAGIDQLRTQRSIQRLVQRMRGGGAPAEPDTDF